MPRVGPIREVLECEFGWRKEKPHEVGYEHPDHVCNDHCVAGRFRDGTGRRYLFHPWRDAG